MDWWPIDTAPFETDLQLSVIENGEVHSLVFPCRRTEDGWSHGWTQQPVPVRPTHWRSWAEISEGRHARRQQEWRRLVSQADRKVSKRV
jgi:hypothetical protein